MKATAVRALLVGFVLVSGPAAVPVRGSGIEVLAENPFYFQYERGTWMEPTPVPDGTSIVLATPGEEQWVVLVRAAGIR